MPESLQISVRRVQLGDFESAAYKQFAYFRGEVPEDGYLIMSHAGGVTFATLYVRDSDLKAADIEGTIIAKGWGFDNV